MRMLRAILTITICLWGSILMPLGIRAAGQEVVQEMNKKIKSASKNNYKEELAKLLVERMATFYNGGKKDSIDAHFEEDKKTLARLEQWNCYYELWTYYINTLIYYNNQKNLALREVQKMFDEARESNQTYPLAITYYTMGNVYLNMNNLEESKNAYQKGLGLMLTISPYPSPTPELYSYLGDVLNELGKYDELQRLTVGWKPFLIKFILENKQFRKEIQDMLWFYYDIACAQSALGQNHLDDADQILQHAKTLLFIETGYEGAAWLNTQAQLRLKQGRLHEAIELNDRRMKLIQPGEDKAVYLTVAAQRASILSQLHRYEESSALYHDMYQIKDSISRADTKNQLNELSTIFQVDELKMQQERAQFRNMLIIIGLILVGLVIFVVFRIIAARRLKKAHDQLQATHEELLTAYDQLEETTTAKERIESDLRIARNIQMGMVPRTFPNRPDLDLYGSMTPAKEVGGDLYGYYLAESNEEGKSDKLYFCLGDVSGKGVPASLFMAQATRLFCTLAAQEMKPAEIATRINNALSGEDNETGMFVTMFLGLLDLETGHLDFCNAGHNPPVLLRNGKPEFIDMVPNAPVGIIPELDYEGEEIADITNSPLFVYTDGLNEAENRQQEQFSDERILELMETVPFESCEQMVEMLRAEVEKHRDGAEPNDDLTMICVKFIKEENN